MAKNEPVMVKVLDHGSALAQDAKFTGEKKQIAKVKPTSLGTDCI
jgi:hypothetical protein